MVTTINVIFSIFFLLPGFIVIKIRHSTSEYRDLTIFEYTTTCIWYSIVILLLWLLYQFLLESITLFQYSFFAQFQQVLLHNNLPILFSIFFLKFILSYLTIVILFGVFIYNIHWTKAIKKFLNIFGLNRFTDHLTPWEDFLITNKDNWLVIELKNGKSLIGKICFHSHLPFKKEIVLKRVDESPITIYENQKKIDLGPDIDQSFINTDEIASIHSIVDNNIVTTETTIYSYCYIAILL